MCGGVYEEDFNDDQTNAPGTDKQISEEGKQSTMESRDRGIEYCYPGSDAQV